MEWARALPSQTIYNALRNAKPVTPISTFAKTRNFRRLYEQAPPPKGLCVIGDAACCFNPVMVGTPQHSSDLHIQCVLLRLHGTAWYSVQSQRNSDFSVVHRHSFSPHLALCCCTLLKDCKSCMAGCPGLPICDAQHGVLRLQPISMSSPAYLIQCQQV